MEITESLPTHPIQPLRMHWAYWQGVAFMLLVFLAYERWMAGGGDLTPEQGLRGWVEIILVTLAFLAALLAWGVKPFLNSFRLSTFVCLILFGTLATISALWSPNFILSLGKAGGLVLITLLASAIAYQAACLGLPVAKMILVALILVSVFLFLINVVEFKTLLRIDWSTNRPRLLLAFDHPNGSSEIFGAGLLVGMYILMVTKFSRRWLFNLLAVVFMTVILLMLDSRAASLAAMASIFLLFLSRLKPKYWVVAFLFVITLTVSTLFLLNLMGYLEPMLLGLVANNPEFITINGRLQLWEAILNNPISTNLIGIGYFGSRYMILGDFSWGINSHNAFLEVFLTTGVIGLITMASFYAACLSLLRSWRAYPLPLAVLAYASINSLTETKLFSPGVLMFVTCILIFHQQFLQQETNRNEAQRATPVQAHD